jgi:hypothetical protein
LEARPIIMRKRRSHTGEEQCRERDEVSGNERKFLDVVKGWRLEAGPL